LTFWSTSNCRNWSYSILFKYYSLITNTILLQFNISAPHIVYSLLPLGSVLDSITNNVNQGRIYYCMFNCQHSLNRTKK
jgi:hypothetical protein